MKGALSYLNECIVDRDEKDFQNPFAYSWEGDNYSRGYSPQLIGCSGETEECVRPLSKVSSEVPTVHRAHCLIVDGPKGSDKTGECVRPLSRVSSEIPTVHRAYGLIVDGPKRSDYTRGPARPLSRVSLEIPTVHRRRVSCGVQSSGVDNEVYELPAIESLGVKTACVRGDAAVLNLGVHGLSLIHISEPTRPY